MGGTAQRRRVHHHSRRRRLIYKVQQISSHSVNIESQYATITQDAWRQRGRSPHLCHIDSGRPEDRSRSTRTQIQVPVLRKGFQQK